MTEPGVVHPVQQPVEAAVEQPAPTATAPASAPVALAPVNRYSIVAIIAAFVLPLAGIVVGLISLGQIRRTGERGRSLALAATVLSVLITIAAIIATVVYILRLASLAGL